MARWWMMAVALVVAGCQTAGEQMTSRYPVGQTFSGSVKYGRFHVPLPPGQWMVASARERGNDVNSVIGEIFLISAENGRLVGDVRITASPNVSRWHFDLDQECIRTNMHHVEKISYYNHDQQCWWINHWRMTRSDNRNELINKYWDTIKENNIISPLNSVGAGFIFGGYSYLKIEYRFNPEIRGFSPPQRADWDSSDWHKDRAHTDPKKVAYLDRVKAWGEQTFPLIKAAFDGREVTGTPPAP